MTIAGSLILAFALTAALLAGLWLLRRAVHRGLAPERIIGTQTPTDFGLAYESVRIPTANHKNLVTTQVVSHCRLLIKRSEAEAESPEKSG